TTIEPLALNVITIGTLPSLSWIVAPAPGSVILMVATDWAWLGIGAKLSAALTRTQRTNLQAQWNRRPQGMTP
ncbi:MAG: hypothetical protein ACXWIS_12735, partial [Burkholderiales bacterium]